MRRSRITTSTSGYILVIQALAFAFTSLSSAQPEFIRIVDTLDLIPGGGGNFSMPFTIAPALDGDRVIFVHNNGDLQELWTANATGGGVQELVDRDASIPNGSGDFTFLLPMRASDGSVVFHGTGEAQAGIYAIDTSGGPIQMLVNQDTPIPDDDDLFTTLVGDYGFDIEGDTVVFGDSFQSVGLYSVPRHGGAVSRLANNGFQICENGYIQGGIWDFRTPHLSNGSIATLVSNTFGEASLYTIPVGGVAGGIDDCTSAGRLRVSNATRVATVNTSVPGDPGGNTFDRFDIAGPPVGSRSDQGTVLFNGGALRPGSQQVFDHVGLFLWGQGAGLRRLVDTTTPVPGGAGVFQAQGFNLATLSLEMAIDGHLVAFLGRDGDGVDGIYLASTTTGSIHKILAEGDSLPLNRTVTSFNGAVHPDALDDGRLVFRAEIVQNSNGFTASAIYVVDLNLSGSGFESGGLDDFSGL